MTTDTQNQTQELVRLSEAEYKLLASQFAPPIVTAQTTELQAGFLLGVQAVLEKLRHGFVIRGY